jgi:hypothetical protein
MPSSSRVTTPLRPTVPGARLTLVLGVATLLTSPVLGFGAALLASLGPPDFEHSVFWGKVLSGLSALPTVALATRAFVAEARSTAPMRGFGEAVVGLVLALFGAVLAAGCAWLTAVGGGH